MTREERALHVATLKTWYRRIRTTRYRAVLAALTSWPARRGWLTLGMVAADARLERRSRAA